ncbi:phosphatidylserine/phosphatidylglycerophosphate/cardiolipin synthase family protein [Gleimia sp. 6138-11-ORH1]|uniref:phospholipase D-like domain-containing protein n=1 Tax=Gleimia sp. 6138-11-ORH1 TaxID=2973937 RepID=UPI002168F631|nr:phosphatidylserine/phosphatidylglycerophosphate/cardiolipin synthase family protein [Gleimia sp. 6138-11-ORH1]MCS4485250.1 phosphatidylserine/phosphatidylglycerophosphate/cardiolipin synthase family protein [Gleimia sp. 6138-11-ORH1]
MLKKLKLNSLSQTAWKGIKTAAVVTAAAQFSAIATLITIGEIRKRRTPPIDGFPALPATRSFVKNNAVTTYSEGTQLYADMLEAIDNAKEFIFFETYIWKSDPVGHAFKEALYRAAERGVKVYCIFDGFANLVVSPRFKKFKTHPNLQVIKIPNVRLGTLTLNLRHTGRDHRKIMVVDGHTGFVGGYNIGLLYAEQWRDTHVRIEGESVWELENGFVDMWNYFRKNIHSALPRKGARHWDGQIHAAHNRPSARLYPVRGMYLDAFERANSNIYLTSAYFIPDREILGALIAASNRGVDVKILIPHNSNHVVVDWISAAFFEVLLEAGVEIWLYKDAMIHAKTATVDGRWTTVGTANLDRLSLTGNYEVNMQFHSKELAKRMEQIFLNDLTSASQLTYESWRKRPLVYWAVERLLKPLGPLF